MKNILKLFCFFILLCNISSYSFGSFEYDGNLSVETQNKLQKQVEGLFNKLNLKYSKITDEKKKTKFFNLSNKIDILLKSKKISDKNIFILMYLNYLINQNLSSSETDIIQNNQISTQIEEKCKKYYFKVDEKCKSIKDGVIYKGILELIRLNETLEQTYQDTINKLTKEKDKQESQMESMLSKMKEENKNTIDEAKKQLELDRDNAIKAYERLGLMGANQAESIYQSGLIAIKSVEAEAKLNESKIQLELVENINEYNDLISGMESKLSYLNIDTKSMSDTLTYLEDTGDENGAVSLLTGIFYYGDVIWIDEYVKDNGIVVKGHYKSKPNETKIDNLNCLKFGGSYCY